MPTIHIGKKPRMLGWWEEYACGCVSETVKTKRELYGYCPKHGNDRRIAHKDLDFTNAPTRSKEKP